MNSPEFYSTTNRHNERKVRIVCVGGLVSKPPTREKRISIKCQMKLSDTVNMGSPEWLDSDYLYVSKNGGTLSRDIEYNGYSIEFSVENLFGEDIKASDAIMRAFEVCEVGKEEHPDVVLNFVVRISYTKRRWEWLGEFQGDEVWMRFTPGIVGLPEKEEDGTLLDDGENDDEDDLDPDNEMETGDGNDPDLDTPEELEYEDGPKLIHSGPKNLAAFHEKVVESGGKKGPGRPRKVPAGFDKPLNQGNSEF
jgi:hypothetical protein